MKGTIGRRILFFLLAMVALIQTRAMGAQSPPSQTSKTIRAWMDQRNQFLSRYLAVVRQATHDYQYGYRTPPALMPVALDLFTGYVARIHEVQERFIYPAVRAGMDAEQQRMLNLIEQDQREEGEAVKRWQQALAEFQPGTSMASLVESIEYVGRMLNRHLVLCEEHVCPVLDSLPAPQQREILARIAAFERQELGGAAGELRYEQLLTGIEEQIQAIAGRIW